jgi:Holliday junction DNA helicase RuvA
MLEYVQGRVEERGPDWVVLDVRGLGLRLEAPAPTIAVLPAPGEDVRLWTHLHIREDLRALYGFITAEERALFQALLTVPKVGPKVALATLSALPPERLAAAINAGDEATLARIRGLGKQTAAQIVLKLKGKLPALAFEGGVAPLVAGDDLAMEALTSMGLTRAEAAALLAALPPDPARPVEETLRLAFQARLQAAGRT